MDNFGLKRVLGLPATAFIAIGCTIGGGVFVFTGIVFNLTGQGLPISYTLASIPVFISMMPLAMLGSAVPTVGGNYKYPSRMVSPGLAFTGVWVYALASFFGQIPLYAIGCAKYVQAIFPEISIIPFALFIVTLFFFINLFGVKIAAQVQGILVLILLSALLFYSFSGLAKVNPENLHNMFEKGSANILLGTALLTFTYFGANGIIELGGEIINPGRTIPRAFFIAFPVIAFVYIAVAIATVGSAPLEDLKNFDEPLISVCKITCSPGGVLFFIIGGAVIALTTTLNALFMFGTKSLLMIVDDNIFPAYLGKIHKRFGTPHILLLIVWCFSVMGLLSGFSLHTFASYSALGGLIVFFPTMLAAIRFPILYPEHYQKSKFKLTGFWLWFCPMVGIFMVLFFGFVLLYDLKSPIKIGCFILFIISGIVYYQARKQHLKSQGIDLQSELKEKGL
jgi:basic amino acid/polyamine antiporter, APA family